MTINTTRRRVLSGVAGGAVALTGAAVRAQADEDVMTPQEEWDVCIAHILDFHKTCEIPSRLAVDSFIDLPDAVRDIADNFNLGKIDRIHCRGDKVDMNYLDSFGFHEERWFLDHVVADVNNQVSGLYCTMYEVAR